MSWFVEVPPEYADDHRPAVAAVKAGAQELGVAEPAVRWFMLSDAKHAAAWTYGESFEMEERPLLVGKSEKYPSTVWIRTGQSPTEMLRTAGHELRHLVQPSDRYDEADAERYGRKFAADFEARPTAIKSANWLPSAEFDRFGAMTAIVPLPPGLRSMTDLGVNLGGDRPFRANGWGLKGERVGQLVDAAASDGELWFRAELDRAHRYRAYIRRLIEQGAVDLKPTADGGFQRMPLLAVTAMPAAA